VKQLIFNGAKRAILHAKSSQKNKVAELYCKKQPKARRILSISVVTVHTQFTHRIHARSSLSMRLAARGTFSRLQVTSNHKRFVCELVVRRPIRFTSAVNHRSKQAQNSIRTPQQRCKRPLRSKALKASKIHLER
jgi:hypothetical protein